MANKVYSAPEIDIIGFSYEDVIQTSIAQPRSHKSNADHHITVKTFIDALLNNTIIRVKKGQFIDYKDEKLRGFDNKDPIIVLKYRYFIHYKGHFKAMPSKYNNCTVKRYRMIYSPRHNDDPYLEITLCY